MESTKSRYSETAEHTATHTRTVLQTRRDGAVVVAVVTSLRVVGLVRRWASRAFSLAMRTVTSAGWLAIAAATVGLAVGIGFGWVEWVVAGLTALALVLVAVPFLLGQPDYQVELSISDQRVVAGSQVDGKVRVVNAGRRIALPGRLEVPVGTGLLELVLPLLRPGREFVESLVVPAQRRGIVVVGPVTAVRADPVGVFRREIAFEDVHQLYVHPETVRVPSTSIGLVRDLEGAPTRQIVDSDVSFHAIRPYAPGDSRRQIHWKSTAKTGTLMVRQYEESRRSRLAVILSCAEEEYTDSDEFELAVSAAASIGIQAVRDGRDLEVIASAEVPGMLRARARTVHTLPTNTVRMLLDACCEVNQVASSTPLAEVCSVAGESVEQLSLAVVVCGAPVGLRTLRQAALSFPSDASVLAVVCDEGAPPSMSRFGSMVVLRIGVLGDLTQLLVRGAA
jgi:hypothetical protein